MADTAKVGARMTTDRNYTPGLYYLIDRVADDPQCSIYWEPTHVTIVWGKEPGGRTVYAATDQKSATEVYSTLVRARG